MIEYSKQTFSSIFNRNEAIKIDSLRFVDCMFESCAISLTKDISKRAVINDVELIRCAFNECDLGPAILNNVRIDTLATNDLFIIWGALFNQVKLSGTIGKMKINQHVHFVDRHPATQQPFDDYRKQFYSSIDWALDISEARFKEFEFSGIPAGLVRRDPESQVVITRERALQSGWQKHVSSENDLWPFMIELFLSDGDDDMVLVAPLGAPKAKRDKLLKGLNELRQLGIAEPD